MIKYITIILLIFLLIYILKILKRKNINKETFEGIEKEYILTQYNIFTINYYHINFNNIKAINLNNLKVFTGAPNDRIIELEVSFIIDNEIYKIKNYKNSLKFFKVLYIYYRDNFDDYLIGTPFMIKAIKEILLKEMELLDVY